MIICNNSAAWKMSLISAAEKSLTHSTKCDGPSIISEAILQTTFAQIVKVPCIQLSISFMPTRNEELMLELIN